MKIIIKDFTGNYKKESFYLAESLDKVGFSINLPVEIYNHPRDVHGEEKSERMKKDIPHFDADESAGEYVNGRIIIYSRTFKQQGIRIDSPDPRKMSILGLVLHEYGHYLWEEIFLKRKLSSLEEWNQARREDGEEKKILSNVFDFVGLYGFYDQRTAEEDFAESTRYFYRYREVFREEFLNRDSLFSNILKSI